MMVKDIIGTNLFIKETTQKVGLNKLMAANGGIKGKLNKPSHGGNAVTTMTASGNLTVQQGTTEVDVLVVAGGGSGGTW
jgi:hypothetical protein